MVRAECTFAAWYVDAMTLLLWVLIHHGPLHLMDLLVGWLL